ncbi:MAG: T9SS type A sorting domain-containing protein [Flavobacteriaceae bacterium]|nr:T9SS type A sorting domain-containing protein [Flavobacteriaceae bacterium]
MKQNYLLLLLVCFLSTANLHAQTTYTAVSNGNWDSATTWSPNGVPVAGSIVNLGSFTVTVTANAACGSLTTLAGSGKSRLNINAGTTLTISGDITIQPSNAFDNNSFFGGSGSITVNNLIVGFPTINNSFPTSTRLTTLYVDDLAELKINGNLVSTTAVNGNPVAFNESRLRHRSGVIDLVGLLSIPVVGPGPSALGYRTDNDNQGNSTIIFRNTNPGIPTDVQKAPSFTGGTVEFRSTATSEYSFPSLAYKNVILNSNRTFATSGSSTSVIGGGRFELKLGVFSSSLSGNQLRINDGVTVVRSGGSFASGLNSRMRLTNASNRYTVVYNQHTSSIVINDLPAYFPGNSLINSIRTVEINSTNGVTLNTNTIQIENLIVNVNCTIVGSGKVFVTGLFDIPNASTVNLPDNFLKLLANTDGVARVPKLNAGTVVNGKVVVDLFLPNSKRSWRLLTAPVTGNTGNSVWENWQNNGLYNGSDIGVDLWGPDGSLEAEDTGSTLDIINEGNGLTLINNSSYNLRKFDNSAGTWSNVRNTLTQPLFTTSINQGFLIFATNPFLGASDLAGVGSSGSSQTTISASGKLIIGDVVYNNIASNKFFLIGNPYASPIDFKAVLDDSGNSGVNKIWTIDPSIGLGSYVTWDAVAGYSNSSSLFNGNTILQSGQAFFVRASAGTTSLTIRENHKSSLVSNATLHKIVQNKAAASAGLFRVQLDKEITGRFNNVDGCVVAFYSGGNNALDVNDARKLTNPSENLSVFSNNFSLSIEHRDNIVDDDSVKIRVTDANAGVQYKLKLFTENFTYQGIAFLQDTYTKTDTQILLDGSVFEYNFKVTADEASFGNRFTIVFKKDVALSLPEFSDSDFLIYPNPIDSYGQIKVNSNNNLAQEEMVVTIYNLSGQSVLERKIYFQGGSAELELNVKLTAGVYVVQFSSRSDNKVYKKKLIIK